MTIHWEWGGKQAAHCNGRAVGLNKVFWNIAGLDVEAGDSDSQTLLAKPGKDV